MRQRFRLRFMYQAASWLLGARMVLICAECGQTFESQMVRAPNRRAFCPKCGRAAAMRAASRDYYASKREHGGDNDGTQTKRG